MGKCSFCDYSATSRLKIGRKLRRFCCLHHYKHNLESEPNSKYRWGWETRIAEIEVERRTEPYKGLYFEILDKILKRRIDKLVNPDVNDREAMIAYNNIKDLDFIKPEIREKWEKALKTKYNIK